MKRNDETFNQMASRILSGELTRKQAAEVYGIPYGTLWVWMDRSKIKVPDNVRAEHKKLHGAALGWGIQDPVKAKALDEAVAAVLSGATSALAASRAAEGISHRTIAYRVRKARIAQGLPVQHRSSRYSETT